MDKLIVITRPEPMAGEGALVEMMLRKGIDFVHIRKHTEAEAEALIREISCEWRSRLRVHYYNDLAKKYGCEFHRPERSCHSVEDLRDNVDYQFLSPIFDSISKEGYKSAFDLKELQLPRNVYALGGVTPAHFEELYNAGFAGAAMLGYIWADGNPENITLRVDAAIYYSYKL